MAEATPQAVTLAEAYGVCGACPYRELVDAEVGMAASQLDEHIADNAELVDEACPAIKTGRCKLATYAIEQQVTAVKEQ